LDPTGRTPPSSNGSLVTLGGWKSWRRCDINSPERYQKVKVRWLDGEYEGLEEWVPKVRLVAPWDEAEALLEDERRMFAALAVSGDVYGTTAYRAVETVFFAIPQEAGAEVWFGMKAIERNLLSIDDLDAAAERLGLDAEELLAEPHSYVDRFGEYKAPFGVAVKVAKHCCEKFAREVLRYLHGEEEELRRELVSGNRDVSRAWWTDNEAYRERAETRLEEVQTGLRHRQGVVRAGDRGGVPRGARAASGARSLAGHGQGLGQVAEERRPSPEGRPGIEGTRQSG
jgi:hypothetical protein